MGTFEIHKSTNEWQHYWKLYAPNGEVIAVSEMYNSKAAAQNGINSVKAWAPTAAVVDLTTSARRF